MTPTPLAEVVRDKTVIVEVPKDSRLETLLTIAGVQREKYLAAQAAYKETQDGILAELQALHPDADIKVYEIPGTGMYGPMAYGYVEQDYLPAPKIRESIPEFYDAWKGQKKFWKLEFRKKGKR